MTTYRKEGDTGPPLGDQLRDDDWDIIPITKWNEVEVIVEAIDDGNIIINDDSSGNVRVPDSEKGKVVYDFQSGDLDEPGDYLYRWVVTFNNGEKETFPNRVDGAVLIVTEN